MICPLTYWKASSSICNFFLFLYLFFGIFVFFCLCAPHRQLSCQHCWLPNKEWHVPSGWRDAGFKTGTAGFTAWCTTIEPPHPPLSHHIPLRATTSFLNFSTVPLIIDSCLKFLSRVPYSSSFWISLKFQKLRANLFPLLKSLCSWCFSKDIRETTSKADREPISFYEKLWKNYRKQRNKSCERIQNKF